MTKAVWVAIALLGAYALVLLVRYLTREEKSVVLDPVYGDGLWNDEDDDDERDLFGNVPTHRTAVTPIEERPAAVSTDEADQLVLPLAVLVVAEMVLSESSAPASEVTSATGGDVGTTSVLDVASSTADVSVPDTSSGF